MESRVKCGVIAPDTKEPCDRTAEVMIEFLDGDRVQACQQCASFMQALAESQGAPHALRIERMARRSA